MRQTQPHLYKKLLLAFASCIFSFLIAELGARIYLFGLKGLSYKLVESNHNIGVSGLIQPASELEIVYELKPGLNDFFKLVSFRTNSMGLREEREFRIDKPSRAFRIAVLGDSYTMGSGIQIRIHIPSYLRNS